MMFYGSRCVSWASEDDPENGGDTPLEAAMVRSPGRGRVVSFGVPRADRIR